jgi:glycine cleavage system transcriptional repressor
MTRRYALSAIGRDCPGIVAAVTGPLHKHGANIEDSSMSILEDEFAVILIMTMDEHRVSSLKEAIKGVEESMGLTFNISQIPELTDDLPPAEPSHVITLHGADAGGLVYRTTELLAGNNINITDLQTKRIKGDEGDIYIMILEVLLPDSTEVTELEEKLNTLATELGVTIKISAVEEHDPL